MQGDELLVQDFGEYSREWAEFVLANRKNRARDSVHSYDVVIGPIANDTEGICRGFSYGFKKEIHLLCREGESLFLLRGCWESCLLY